MMEQLELELKLESREDKLVREMRSLKEQCEKVRKSQFAKLSELKRQNDELKYEMESLKLALCKYGDKHFLEYI